MNRQRKILITVIYNDLGIIVDTKAEELDLSTNLQQTCNQLATDCISRQQAIEAFEPTHHIDWYTPTIIETLEALPSVQQEIIRCKDRKWFGEAGCAIRIVDDSDKPNEEDFCSFAER